MLRDFRKPLVIAAPKIGLKHPKAVSKITEFQPGTSFQPVLANRFGEGSVKNVVFCSGKVNFDIQARLEMKAPSEGTLMVRIEELAPFPVPHVANELVQSQVSSDAKFTWMQEEPVNQGAHQFARLHLDRLINDMGFNQSHIDFVGRPAIHSFATGAVSCHKREGEQLWRDFDAHIYN